MEQVDVNGHSTKSPDIFSRGVLELTFRLLRHHNPTLALVVQNVLASKKLPTLAPHDSASDHFYVNIDAITIGKIVAALTEIGEQALQNEHHQDGIRIVIKTLIHEWIVLTESIVHEVQQQ